MLECSRCPEVQSLAGLQFLCWNVVPVLGCSPCAGVHAVPVLGCSPCARGTASNDLEMCAKGEIGDGGII